MSRTFYGLKNVAFYNSNPSGSEVWFSSRAKRDEALEALRAEAVRHGLGEMASVAGIFAIEKRLSRSNEISEMEDRIARM